MSSASHEDSSGGARLTYNLPPLHLVDYDRFVKAWKKDGTQRMDIFKGAEAAGPDDPNSAHKSGAPPPLCHISFTTLPVKNRPFDTTFLGLGLRL